MAGGTRKESRTGVLISAEERREVLGRIRGDGTASPRRSGGGERRTVTGRRDPPPVTKEAGPGTPGGVQGTREAESAMVLLDATALEGGGTPSDIPEQQHGSPILPLGGGGGNLSDTAGKYHGGLPAFTIYVLGETRE